MISIHLSGQRPLVHIITSDNSLTCSYSFEDLKNKQKHLHQGQPILDEAVDLGPNRA